MSSERRPRRSLLTHPPRPRSRRGSVPPALRSALLTGPHAKHTRQVRSSSKEPSVQGKEGTVLGSSDRSWQVLCLPPWTSVRTHTDTHTLRQKQARAHASVNALNCTHSGWKPTGTHTHTHTCTLRESHTGKRTHTFARYRNAHVYGNARMYACTQTHTHTHARAHIEVSQGSRN